MIQAFTMVITLAILCCNRYPNATHLSGFESSQMLHFNSLVCFHVISGVSLPRAVVSLCSLRCHTTAYLGAFMLFQVSYSFSLWLLCAVLNVPLLLTRLLSCHSRHFTAAYSGSSVMSQMPNCHPLCWFCAILFVLLLLLSIVLHHSNWLIAFHCVALCHSSSLTADHHDCSELSKIFNWRLIEWLWNILYFPIPFNKFALCHLSCLIATHWSVSESFRCPTATYWNYSMSFHLPFCLLLGWLHVVLSVSPSLYEVGVCHFWFFSSAPWCEFSLSSLSHCLLMRWMSFILPSQCHSLWVFCIVSVPICYSLPLTGMTLHLLRCSPALPHVALQLPRYYTATSWVGST